MTERQYIVSKHSNEEYGMNIMHVRKIPALKKQPKYRIYHICFIEMEEKQMDFIVDDVS